MARLADRISDAANDAYTAGSLSAAARSRRWRELAAAFPQIEEMRVLDLGGDARAWRAATVRPAHVTLLNVFPQDPEEPWMTAVAADACAPPDTLPEVDLVYSNSVIEHLGGHWRRQRFAEVVRAAAARCWVQTPYRYFPIEPHFLLPALQHMPRRVQVEAVRRWPLGGGRAVHGRDEALAAVMDVELLTVAELRGYFPDAEIRRERYAGLVKSLIAVRGGQSASRRASSTSSRTP